MKNTNLDKVSLIVLIVSAIISLGFVAYGLIKPEGFYFGLGLVFFGIDVLTFALSGRKVEQ